MKKWLLAATALMTAGAAHAITINPTTDASVLTGSIAGSGVTIYNAQLSGSATRPAGTFTGGDFGIGTGIILSTGDVLLADGPNTSASSSGAGETAELTFDFDTTTGDVSFRYVFASEEYEEFVDEGFNDIFRLEINGMNIALIPGTDDAVAIDSVNQNENTQYYRSNTGGALNAFDLQYDGLTTVLTASLSGLALTGNTARFFITDSGDEDYDSAVFIAGGTFSSEPDPDPDPVPEPAALGLLGLGALGLAQLRRRKA